VEDKIIKIKSILTKKFNLKNRLDEIDNIVKKAAQDGYLWSRFNIIIGEWEKGKAIEEYIRGFRGVNPPSYYKLEKQTNRYHTDLKRWHNLYKNNPDREKYILIAKKQAESWTERAFEYRRPKEKNILAPIEGIHEVIVIDPPWPYGTEYNKETRRVASPYKELSIEQLNAFKLPVADNCVLWLWTTHKFIRDAFNLLDVWEFDYKLTFVWDKEKLGIGKWLRCQAEFCLLAIKGKPRWNLTNERDVLRIPRGKHSEKPDEFYNMVKKLCPTKGEYADIFFRKERLGWRGYGDKL